MITEQPWKKFRTEIQSEPIKFITIHSEICIRTRPSQSENSFQSRLMQIDCPSVHIIARSDPYIGFGREYL